MPPKATCPVARLTGIVTLALAALLAILAILAVPLPALAAGAEAGGADPAEARFGESVDVELVNVEVWVTDKDGRPVEGLPAEAFRLTEDRERMELAYFDEVRAQASAGATSSSASSSSATSSVASSPEPALDPPLAPQPASMAPTSDPGHLVIYFDELHLSTRGRKDLIANLRTLLDSPDIDPGRVLVLRQDEAISVEAPFGSNREQIDAALDRIAEPRGSEGSHQTAQETALRYLRTEWRIAAQVAGSNPAGGGSEAGCGPFLNRVLPYVETESRRLQGQINITLEHLYATAGFLSAIPGVKSLVYVSDSLELTPGSSLQAYVGGLCRTSALGRRKPDIAGDLHETFREVSRNAAAHRVTFYGLQAGGLRTGAITADDDTIDVRSASRYQNQLRTAERTGMQYLATETGGRAVFNQNNLTGALIDIVHDTASYYSLAYIPDHVGDGHEHKIRVKLTGEFDRRGLRVRHRKGYQHKAANALLGERLQAALFMGFGENPLGVRLGAGSPAPSALSTTPDFLVPLHVYVPAGAVTFVPTENATEARVFVQVAVRSPGGGRPRLLDKTWTIEGPAGEDATFDLKMDLELDGGLSTVAVAVRDELSREVSFLSTSVALPEAGQATPASSP